MRAWLALGASAGVVAALVGTIASGCASGTETGATGPSLGGFGVGAGPIGGTGGSGLTGAGGAGGDACAGPEVCNGLDDDCDSEVDEGCTCAEGDTQPCYSGDPALHGVGVCTDGVQSCDLGGAWGECVGEGAPGDEICNGLDDDCDGDTDEDIPDAVCGLGICQVTVPGCADGEPVPCIPGEPQPPEDCEGTDDECDGDVDENCPCVDGQTQACYTGSEDTRGVGECHDGLATCDDQGVWGACTGDQTPDDEECNGLDDDCDGTEDDGNPGSGAVCNTGLPGICSAGLTTCADGELVCQPIAQPTDDVCNGLDDDCDPSSADGSEGPQAVGQPCDGADSDLCTEGSYTCVNGTLGCSDNTSSNLDVCNGSDDDCDSNSADGTEGPQAVGMACDGADSDLCTEGVHTCANGTLGCSDNTGGTSELCAGDAQDEDCDGSVDEGFTRNDNPVCSDGQYYLGAIPGDEAGAVLEDSWYNEEWDRFRLTEDDNGIVYLSAVVELYSPPGVDFDLYVRCDSCTGGVKSSTVTSTSGHWDYVYVHNDDDWGFGDDFDVYVEIRHKSSNRCAYWHLYVTGDVAVGSDYLDCD